MIIPSIDLMAGQAVQLVGGETLAVEAGDPMPLAERFGLVGEIAVIDLDAARSHGKNHDTIRALLRRAPCRVGGGIRDRAAAEHWLDAGARKVILGTAARAEILRDLPRDRVIAALDTRHGEVVTEGWTHRTGEAIERRIEELREHVGGFLVTFVEREGRMVGLPEDRVARLVELAGPARLTVAGGVRTPADIAAADRAGADAQVGMALYTGAFDLAEGFCAPLTTDRPDGLWPTIVTEESGAVLGLVYSSLESVRAAIAERRGVFFSRSRGGLWRKGDNSGDTQELISIATDCDRDALRVVVRQHGRGFCHLGLATCFGPLAGLPALDATVATRLEGSTPMSYTDRLARDASLLSAKLIEEARELSDAATPGDAAHEAADLIYFTLVAARARGASLADIARELDVRAIRVTRRPGDAKPSMPSGGIA